MQGREQKKKKNRERNRGSAKVRGAGGAPCHSRCTWRDCNLWRMHTGVEERIKREGAAEKLLCSDCSPCLVLLIALVVGPSVTCIDYKGRGEELGVKLCLGMGEEGCFSEACKCLFLCFCFLVTKSVLIHIIWQQIKLS